MSAVGRLRLFVALDLPGPVREALATWSAACVGGSPGYRLVPARALHVTLCFLGPSEAGEVDAIAAACRVVGVQRPPTLSVAEPLWLPPRRPRVLAVGLDDPAGSLARLQSTLAAALVSGGWYTPERRPFLPHVTVARVRQGAPAELPGLVGAPAPAAFPADRVSLYRSHTGAGGARYEALATVVLSGPLPPA